MKGKKWLYTGMFLLLGMTGMFVTAKAAMQTEQNAKPSNPVYIEGADQGTWDCVYYGHYPQSEVTDKKILEALSALPESAYSKTQDVTLDGVKYRRMSKKDALNTDVADGYYDWSKGGNADGYHFFVYEPIVWRILQTDEKGMLLLADTCVEDKKYHNKAVDVTWKESSLRSWLNGYGTKENIGCYDYSKGNAFTDFAFTEEEKEMLISYEVQNNDNSFYHTKGGETTKDKVFLLSLEDMQNSRYGFSSKVSTSHTRVMQCSDYAWARGIFTDSSSKEKRAAWWWLRTAGKMQDEASGVLTDGYILYNASESVNNVENGVCPVIYLSWDADWKLAGQRVSITENPVTSPIVTSPSPNSTPDPSPAPDSGVTATPTEPPTESMAPSEEEWQENNKVQKVKAVYKNKTQACITWKKVADADGYAVRLSTRRHRKRKIITFQVQKNKCVLPFVREKSRYVIRVCAYKKEEQILRCAKYSDKVVYRHIKP